MPHNLPDPTRPAVALELAAVAAALLAIGVFVGVSVLRMPYPFQLEWLEGESLHYVARVLAGEPLYVAPSLEFIPYLYTPLYFYLSALPAKLLGLGLPSLRLVSLVASLGTLAVIFEMVRRETRGIVPGVLAAGLFAATYRASGAFLDLARVDALFLLLCLGGIFAAGFGRRAPSAVLAGLLAVAAWQTKQLAAVVFLPVIAHLLWTDRRRGLLAAGTVAVAGAASVMALAAVHGPWFRFYVHDLPGSHALGMRQLFTFWPFDIAAPLPIALVLALLYLIWPQAPGPRGRYAAAAVGLLAAAWLGRLNPGGYDNVLLPGFAALAVGFGLGADRARRLLSELPSPALRERALGVLHVALVVQMAALAYDPRPLVPSLDDRAAGEALVEEIRGIEGPVFLPEHGYLVLLAGKAPHAHRMAIQDALGELSGEPTPHAERLLAELHGALHERRFTAIALSDPYWFYEEIEALYRRGGPVFDRDDVFWPPTGHPYRPWLWFEADGEGQGSQGPEAH